MSKALHVFRSSASRERLFERYDTMLGAWPETLRSAYVQTAFGATHVLVCGPEDGTPVLLLHPLHSNAAFWTENVRLLAQERRVYALDIMGDAGKSELEQELPFGFDRPWLLQVIDSLFLDRVDVIAASGACQIAVNLSCYVPERIRNVVLISPRLNGMLVYPEHMRHAKRARRFPSEKNLGKFFSRLAPSLKADHEVLAYLAEVLRASRYPSYQLYDPTDFGGCGPDAPTLMLLGDREQVSDPGVVRKLSERLFANLTVRTVAGVGHFMPIEQPAVVNEFVVRFLDDGVARIQSA